MEKRFKTNLPECNCEEKYMVDHEFKRRNQLGKLYKHKECNRFEVCFYDTVLTASFMFPLQAELHEDFYGPDSKNGKACMWQDFYEMYDLLQEDSDYLVKYYD